MSKDKLSNFNQYCSIEVEMLYRGVFYFWRGKNLPLQALLNFVFRSIQFDRTPSKVFNNSFAVKGFTKNAFTLEPASDAT